MNAKSWKLIFCVILAIKFDKKFQAQYNSTFIYFKKVLSQKFKKYFVLY